ncbi:MAG TPA: hypothetical protein VGL87_01720 [Steroidobacteraceae bacterium]
MEEPAPLLTFVIPLRHPQNSPDWGALKRRLEQTIRSIAAQDDPRWRAIIVANAGADLPELPQRFLWKPVDFPPNPLFEQGDNDLEAFRDACRLDKGRRVLAGVLAAGTAGYVMVVDDDDLVSRRLTGFVAEHRGKSGWYVEKGYLWGDGGKLLYQYADFSTFCGTSHIVRADLYDVSPGRPPPGSALVRTLFGSHIFIREYLAARGRPLEPLPFLGAVYRIGHAGAHSKSPGLLRQVFFRREMLRHPLRSVQRLSGLRLLGPSIRRQFWGVRP